jgi:hypothetical protein
MLGGSSSQHFTKKIDHLEIQGEGRVEGYIVLFSYLGKFEINFFILRNKGGQKLKPWETGCEPVRASSFSFTNQILTPTLVQKS